MTDKKQEMKRPSRRGLLQAAVTVAPLAIFSRTAKAQQQKPNFLFLMADDLGYADLSCYGRRDYTTPNIDRLADQGVKFTQAYANSAVCTSTRVALATGRYQHRLEVGLYEPLGGNNANAGLPPGHPTIASALKDVGYGTALIGKWHIGDVPAFGPTRNGYDHFWGFAEGALDYFTHKYGGPDSPPGLWDGEVRVEEHGYLTYLIAEKTNLHIRDWAESGTPFLASVHFNAPHWPWEGPEDGAAAEAGGLSSFEAGDLATYGKMVRAMDYSVGSILEQLEASGVADNTVVVFTSDNGGERFSDTWPFTGRKTELLEGGIRIPAIVRWPGHIAPGSETDQVAMSMDWMPTFVSMAGGKIDPAYPSDGMDLTAALQGASPVSRKVFWRYHANGQHAMREGDMKYLMINGNEFLFNVLADPLERANLSRKMPDVFEDMKIEFDEWNGQMLSEDQVRNSYSFFPRQLADHYNPVGAPRRPAAAKPKPSN